MSLVAGLLKYLPAVLKPYISGKIGEDEAILTGGAEGLVDVFSEQLSDTISKDPDVNLEAIIKDSFKEVNEKYEFEFTGLFEYIISNDGLESRTKLKDTIIEWWNREKELTISYPKIDGFVKDYFETITSKIHSNAKLEEHLSVIKIKELAEEILKRVENNSTKDDKIINLLNMVISRLDTLNSNPNTEQQPNNQNTPVQQNVDTLDEFTQEYIKNYEDDLFLEENNDITLGKMYVEPYVVGHNEKLYTLINEWFANRRSPSIMFVVGDAGVGKTSLVSKIIADSRGLTEHPDYTISSDKIHPIILRSVIPELEDSTKDGNYSVSAVIEKITNLNRGDLDDSLIILDGLDELVELSNSFDFKKFLDKLISIRRIKFLITTRPIDFLENIFSNNTSAIINYHIKWGKKQISEWCDNYSSKKNDTIVTEWCNHFKENYDDLAQNDTDGNKMDIFSVPVILYIACFNNITIDKNDTIGSFYDRVFRCIASREHLEYSSDADVFINENERKKNIINWQYTKELAYQMFLNNTLTLSDETLIKNAKKRTEEVLIEQKIIPKENDFRIDNLNYLAVCHFAKPTDNKIGVLFAHKTVYEYFTAVKLYEDYFAEFNTEYYTYKDEDTVIDEVFGNIVEAFRYKKVSEDIFKYLNEMKKSKYIGTKDDNNSNGFDYAKFEETYVKGMEKRIWSEISPQKPCKEYKISNMSLTTQISYAFRNLSFFLTGHGFNNKDNIAECKEINDLLVQNIEHFNASKWNLRYANLISDNLSNANLSSANLSSANLSSANLISDNLSNANLSSANLSYANLRYADLWSANLSDAYLGSADLRYANLRDANLRDANLISANLRYANLSYADLSNANLRYANLSNARYTAQTEFPDGFEPEEHDMIEVDEDGNPI